MAFRISLVTVCRNAVRTIPFTLESVRAQHLPEGVELEQIVVDGASTDGTCEVLEQFSRLPPPSPAFTYSFRSEPDRGLYDAINKGLHRATGEVVGILNADDVLATDEVVARLAEAFRANETWQVVYGDVRFVRGGDSLTELREAACVRYCTGRHFRPWMFRFATFPAHPSTFVRRSCYRAAGDYSLDYPICADFEMMLRLFKIQRVRAQYLPLCTTVMRLGGLSTSGLRCTIEINREDLRALRAHGIWSCLPLVYLKYFFKVWGFFR